MTFTPDEAELSDIEIKFVTVLENPDNRLTFDVVVSAEIEIHQRMKHSYSESDGIEQWFCVSCSATLKNGLHNFQTHGVHIYYKSRRPEEGLLSDYLVPITYKKQLEGIAEDFLKRHFPEALEKPMAIPVKELAESMGLKIEHVNLSKACNVFGQICFSDCEAKFYDCDSRSYKNMEVRKGTIIVDPNVFFMRNVGSVNNTIMHECIHWDRHSLFFELAKIFNPTMKGITCQVHERRNTENNGTPYEWMEWQANHLAPRILMPARTTKQKIEELIEKNERILPDSSRADIIESVIFELSEFFGVSRMSAKIRMLDLGYHEAEGVYTYVDGHYVQNYYFECDALQRGQTYAIGTKDALFQYASNLKFRELVDSGNYVFVENHFCINDSKYIKHSQAGEPQLTDYARQHIDECCFVFDIKYRDNKQYGAKYYSECTLFRSAISNKISETVYDDSAHNRDVAQRAKDLKDTVADIMKIKAALPAQFSETLVAHMKRKQCTVEKLAELSLIGPKTIQRMRNDENLTTSIGNVVAICIGLQLHPVFSRDLIQKAGLGFKGGEKHITYEMLIDSFYNQSIHYCNEILEENGFPPLGTEQ